MKWRILALKAVKYALIVVVVLFVLLCIATYIDGEVPGRDPKLAQTVWVDRNIVPLPGPVSSIKDGLTYADERAGQWRQNAELTYVYISFSGIDEVRNRQGTIKYHYQFTDESEHGFMITIEMGKQAITRAEWYRQGVKKERMPRELLARTDINDIMTIIEDEGVSRYLKPHVSFLITADSFLGFSKGIKCKVWTSDEVGRSRMDFEINWETRKITKMRGDT